MPVSCRCLLPLIINCFSIDRNKARVSQVFVESFRFEIINGLQHTVLPEFFDCRYWKGNEAVLMPLAASGVVRMHWSVVGCWLNGRNFCRVDINCTIHSTKFFWRWLKYWLPDLISRSVLKRKKCQCGYCLQKGYLLLHLLINGRTYCILFQYSVFCHHRCPIERVDDLWPLSMFSYSC